MAYVQNQQNAEHDRPKLGIHLWLKKKGRFGHDLQRHFGLLRCARTVVRTSIWLGSVTVAAASFASCVAIVCVGGRSHHAVTNNR